MATVFKTILSIIALAVAVTPSEMEGIKSALNAVQLKPTVLGVQLTAEGTSSQNTNAANVKTKKKKVTLKEAKLKVQQAKDSYDPLDKFTLTHTFTSEVFQELEEYNYNALVMQARDGLSNAESALSRRQYNVAFDAAVASFHNSSAARAVLLQSPLWNAQKEQINKGWWRLIDEVQKRIPEAIKKPLPPRDQEFMPVNLLLTCPMPMKVPPRRSCQGKWELKTGAMECPYLACVKNKKEVPACAGALSYVNRDPKKGSISQRCCPGLKEVRVDKSTGECKKVAGWMECAKDIDCPQPLCTEIQAVCIMGVCGNPTCPLRTLLIGRPTRPVEWPAGTIGCCLAGQGGCTPMPREQCLAQNGREIPVSECDKTNICGEVGCCFQDRTCQVMIQRDCLAKGGHPYGSSCSLDSCPTSFPTPAPTSTEPPIACCLPGGACTVVAIDICKNSMNGKPAPQSSCDPNQCSPSTSALPPTSSTYDRCMIGGIKDYQCPSGKFISWRCECFNFTDQPVADWYYHCTVEPIKSCPAQTRLAPLTVTGIYIRYLIGGIKGGPGAIQIFWDTNVPTISHIEYGLTTAYGVIARGSTGPVGSLVDPGTGHVEENQGLSVGLDDTAKLRPDTLYHFRIVATDTQGNTLTSNDYTFSTTRPYGSKHWIECQAGAVMQKTCVNGELVDRCRCTSEGQWNCAGNIESSCPVPVATPTSPAIPTTGCKTGEIKKYQCPDGALVDYCKCTWEGKWDCLSYPEKLCPVQPTAPMSPAPTFTECRVGETKYYNCPQGIEVTACKCTWEGKWDCIISPEKSCPVPITTAPATALPDTTPPNIYSVTTPDILATAAKIEWKTDEPATSLLDYGPSSAYGAQKLDASLVPYHSIPLSDLLPNTTYYFRIIAIDAKGNKTETGSYTFKTAVGQ